MARGLGLIINEHLVAGLGRSNGMLQERCPDVAIIIT